jgi:hypothetical protein
MIKYNAKSIGDEIQYIGKTIQKENLLNGYCYTVIEIHDNHIIINNNMNKKIKIKHNSYYSIKKI